MMGIQRFQTMGDRIEKRIELKAPIARVWRALTESGFENVPSDRREEAFRRNDGWSEEQMKNIESYLG